METPVQAFERELLTLLPRLRRFARSLARDAADADDLCQVALERALKAKDQWQAGTRLDAWMYRITRRSEEHTSELQSLMRISYAVFCLKKKNKLLLPTYTTKTTQSP